MSDLAATYEALVGLEEYEPLQLVEGGSFGVILRVREKESGERLILKVPAEGPAQLNACQRLEREAQVLTRYQHPNVVTLYRLRSVPAGPCLVMEDLGDDPFDMLEVEKVGVPKVVELMLQIAGALEFLHSRELIHRDVKPGNILRVGGDRAVLIDFGGSFHPDLSQWTAPGHLFGTLPYISPEVYRGGLITPAADWFSWGMCLYRVIEGEVPFEDTQYEEAVAERTMPPVHFARLEESDPVADLIRACLEDDPDRRPDSVERIRALLAGGGPWRRLVRWFRGRAG